jgi:hypothetical protein
MKKYIPFVFLTLILSASALYITDAQQPAGGYTSPAQGGTGSGVSVQIGGTPTASQTVLNFICGTNISCTDGGAGALNIALTGLATAPNTIAAVSGKYLNSYNQATGNFTNANLAPFSPQTSTTDTLTNASLITEQFFATTLTIPANTIAANTRLTFWMGGDYTGTGTPQNGTLKVKLCTGLNTGCVNVYQSSATPPGVNTRSASLPIILIGTAAPGASTTIISATAAGQSSTVFGNNNISSIIPAVATNGALFLEFTIQYAATTASSSFTLTSLSADPGPII